MPGWTEIGPQTQQVTGDEDYAIRKKEDLWRRVTGLWVGGFAFKNGGKK